MYFTIDIWAGIGEWAHANLHKGDQIVVEGRLRWREYEKDGQRREIVSITADSLIPPRGERRQQQPDAPFDTSGLPSVDEPPPSSSRPPDEDEIPF